MQIQTAVLCDSAAAYEGKLSILGAFDTIWAPQFPAAHHHCAVALRVLIHDADTGSHSLQARFIDPDGRCVLADQGPRLTMTCPPLPPEAYFVSQNYIFYINGLPLPAPGQYRFDICLDEDAVVAQIPVQVILRQNS